MGNRHYTGPAIIAALLLWPGVASAQTTVTIGIGTQDTTTNTVTTGTVIRELKLFEKHLPKDGKYASIKFQLEWNNFTSGPPVTNGMMANKLHLLNLVAGFLMPDGGEIAIDGRRVTDVPPYRRESGIMFQQYALFPHMSVAANVGYGLKMRRIARPEIARRVAEALALIKLGGLEDRKPRQLSGGQQQRVALARALVIRPKVLLLDEPFSALDRNLRASMQVEIKEIQRKLGVTTIFVTHDQSEALSLSDRIVVMSDGRIRQLGTPDEIYCRPVDRFVASFVGDVNVLHARLEQVEGPSASLALGPVRVLVPASTLQGAAPGAMVDLFVRPEQLRVAGDA